MKKLVLFTLCLAIALSSAAVIAAPVGSTAWGTVSATQTITGTINNQANTLAESSGRTAANVAQSLKQTLLQAGMLNPDLAAIDTTTLSSTDLATYADTVTNFNLALRHAIQVATSKEFPDTAGTGNQTLNALIGVVMTQANADQVFYNALFNGPRSPVGAIIWGTHT